MEIQQLNKTEFAEMLKSAGNETYQTTFENDAWYEQVTMEEMTYRHKLVSLKKLSSELITRKAFEAKPSFEPIRLRAQGNGPVVALVPNGWTPVLPPNLDMQRYQHTVGHFANKHPFATWMVFERLPEFDESHGPKRFSLLFLCADGVAAYQALYWTNQMTPRAIAIIQPGTGFGGNWTDFFKKDDPFYWTVSHNPAGMPDYVYCGYWSQSKATSASDTPEHIHFDWPDYTYSQPAVGYPQSEVFLYKKEAVQS